MADVDMALSMDLGPVAIPARIVAPAAIMARIANSGCKRDIATYEKTAGFRRFSACREASYAIRLLPGKLAAFAGQGRLSLLNDAVLRDIRLDPGA